MKTTVLLLMGGMSGEHEVSVKSAKSVLNNLDGDKFDSILVGISKTGAWYLLEGEAADYVFNAGAVLDENLDASLRIPGAGSWQDTPAGSNFDRLFELMDAVDVVFPVMHGPNAEDGTLQGFLDHIRLPYVGCGVTASAVAMDKIIAKAVFKNAGIPVVDDVFFTAGRYRAEKDTILSDIENKLGYPVFVKPANMGSSVGISKAKDRISLAAAIEEALRFDTRILVEKGLTVRELECAALGHGDVLISDPGEVLTGAEFYDYKDKYVNGVSRTQVPADVPEAVKAEVKRLARIAFDAIDGSGLSRIDFFLEEGTGKLYLNEINTLPGFTDISMYPTLAASLGYDYKNLITHLIDLAFARWEERNSRQVSL